MKYTIDKNSILLKGYFFLILCLLMPQTKAYWGIEPVYKYGAVYARDLVKGANGEPIYVIYSSETGKEIQEVGEAVGELARDNAKVVSADYYNSWLSQYQNLITDNPDFVLVKRDQFTPLGYVTVNGNEITNIPELKKDTLYVVIPGVNQRFNTDGKNFVQLELPIDPNVLIFPGSKSLILLKNGTVHIETENNIGFRAGFFGTFQKADGIPGDRSFYDTIYGPLKGISVEIVGNKGSAVTTDEGTYGMSLITPPCPGFVYTFDTNAYAEVYYRRFSPRGEHQHPYYMARYDTYRCNGLGAYSAATGLPGIMTGLAISAIETAYSNYGSTDFPVDLMFLSGKGVIKNPDESAVKVTQQTVYNHEQAAFEREAQQQYDLDGDGINDTSIFGKIQIIAGSGNDKEFVRVAATDNPEVQGVWLSSVNGQNVLDTVKQLTTAGDLTSITTFLPDFTRLPDWKPDFNHRALLSEISEEDFRNTDLYVFRESNGAIIAERKGLKPEEIVGSNDGVGVLDGEYYYNMLILGSIEGIFNDFGYANSAAEFEQWQKGIGIIDERQYKRAADHLRPGENVRLIAINRVTGYIGTLRTELKATGSDKTKTNEVTFKIEDLEMKPPNLKIWAERYSEVKHGLTAGEYRFNYIGSEGAGLADDKKIVIFTEWFDQDGSPLPETLTKDYAYTGRLAQVIDGLRLQEVAGGVVQAGNALSHFSIRPGRHMQVVRTPDSVANKQHFYIQVNANPVTRTIDFGSYDTHQGILQKRPKQFVPFKVQIFDEDTTNELTQVYQRAIENNPDSGIEKPEPVYQWLYRPEFQFSVYDLVSQKINFINASGGTQEVDLSITNLNVLELLLNENLETAELNYDLLGSDFEALQRYSGDTELVFSIGGQEELATVTPGGSIQFSDFQQLNYVSSDEVLAIRLYANNDSTNVLYEYALSYDGVIQHSITQGNPGVGKREIRSDLRDDYFYPELGHKKLFINVPGFGSQDEVTLIDVGGSNITSSPEAGTAIEFANGYAKFLLLSTDDLVPNPNEPNKPITLTFRVNPDPNATSPRPSFELKTDIIIKNNSNVTLQEVLDGQAVWTYTEIPATVTADADKEKYIGKTQGATPNEQFFDYGQYMLNMITIPMIEDVKESNIKYSIDPTGIFDLNTEELLTAWMDPSLTSPIPKFSSEAMTIRQSISHFDQEEQGDALLSTDYYRSFRKLLQDYQTDVDTAASSMLDIITSELDLINVPKLIFDYYRYKIITPELVRGLYLTNTEGVHIAANGAFNYDDLGFYEMYQSYDWDGDGVSNLAEVENATNVTSQGISTSQTNIFNPLNSTDSNYGESIKGSYPRGYGSINLFSGTPPLPNDSASTTGPGLIYSGASHVHGLRMPTFAAGLYDLGPGDTRNEANQDSYAIPAIIRIIETAAREYAKEEPDVYPLESDPGIHALQPKQSNHSGFRWGINDISVSGGGMVYSYGTPPNWQINVAERNPELTPKIHLAHVSHHSGLDVDLRFVTKKETTTIANRTVVKRKEKVVNFKNNPGDFDYDATLKMYEAINLAAKANGYKITKLFAGDTDGPFPGTLTEFRAFCKTFNLVYNVDCKKSVKPHRHHTHMRFAKINDVEYSLNMTDENIVITIPNGQSTADRTIPIDVKDIYDLPAITYTRLRYSLLNQDGTIDTNDSNAVVSVTTPYNNTLFVNPLNNSIGIGKVFITFTCNSASTEVQEIIINEHPNPTPAVRQFEAIGSVFVTCQSASP